MEVIIPVAIYAALAIYYSYYDKIMSFVGGFFDHLFERLCKTFCFCHDKQQ